MNAKTKMRDEMFKYKMGYKGFEQLTLDKINSIPLFKWKRRAKKFSANHKT